MFLDIVIYDKFIKSVYFKGIYKQLENPYNDNNEEIFDEFEDYQ